MLNVVLEKNQDDFADIWFSQIKRAKQSLKIKSNFTAYDTFET